MLTVVRAVLTELSHSTELHLKVSPGFKENRFGVRGMLQERWSKREDGASSRCEKRAALDE